MDNLKWGRVEIDLVEFRGPTLGSIDNRLMALELVKASLTRAILFDPQGRVIIPSDALHRQSVIGMRGAFHPVTASDQAMFDHAKALFLSEPANDENKTVLLAEMTMADLANDGEVDTSDFLSRVLQLQSLGFHVLISEFYRYFRVRQYLARHTLGPIAMVMDVDGFSDFMSEKDYEGLSGGLLEGLGQLFPPDTIAYVYPKQMDGRLVTLDEMPIEKHLLPLVAFLRERGHIIAIDDFKP